MTNDAQQHTLETVRYTPGERVSVVTMNRPQAMNSFDTALRRDLLAALKSASEDASRAVVLHGEGRSFGVGADLKEGFPDNMVTHLNNDYRPLFDAIADCPKPVISAIHGATAGISLSLALYCDLSVMAEDAFLLAPFTTIGLVPDGGAHFIFGRAMGYKRAFQALVEAERIGASEALACGLVNKVVSADALEQSVMDWADTYGDRPPLAVARIKTMLRAALTSDFDTVFKAEAEAQQASIDSDDAKEGVDAFLNKRAPVFKGR